MTPPQYPSDTKPGRKFYCIKYKRFLTIEQIRRHKKYCNVDCFSKKKGKYKGKPCPYLLIWYQPRR